MPPQPGRLTGYLHLAPFPGHEVQVYPVLVCTMTGHSAMVLADLPAGARQCLFGDVSRCTLEIGPGLSGPDRIVSKAIWLQPQAAAGNGTTFKIGFRLENRCPSLADTR